MFKRITIFVVTLHLFLMGFLLFSPAKNQKIAAKRLVVRTEKFRSPTKASQPRPAAKPSPKPAAKKNKIPNPPPPKKTTKKPAVADKGKPKPGVKKVEISEKDTPEPPAKIEAKRENVYSSPKLDVPTELRTLAIDHREENFNMEILSNDSDAIVAYLHESLHLPDYGEVKIQLTVREDGSVAKLVVLKAESVKNKAYLEKNLPLLVFPSLERKEQTFIFTFCNEL
jgi:outer membrane biosynthesis protein TonB